MKNDELTDKVFVWGNLEFGKTGLSHSVCMKKKNIHIRNLFMQKLYNRLVLTTDPLKLNVWFQITLVK